MEEGVKTAEGIAMDFADKFQKQYPAFKSVFELMSSLCTEIKQYASQQTAHLQKELGENDITILTLEEENRRLESMSQLLKSAEEENKLLREALEKIKDKSVYDANHDNIMYNYQEVHKIAKDTLTQLSTTNGKQG